MISIAPVSLGGSFAAVLDEIIDYPRDNYPLQVLSLADMDAPDHARATATSSRNGFARHARGRV